MIVEIQGSDSSLNWYHDPKWIGCRLKVKRNRHNSETFLLEKILNNNLNSFSFQIALINVKDCKIVSYESAVGKVTINKGLPGSGKSTATKKKIDEACGKIKRVNRDDLRAMIDNGTWSKANEKLIKEIEMNIILSTIGKGIDIIVDDTNLVPETIKWIEDSVYKVYDDAEIVIDDSFLDVPLEVCLERNLNRPIREIVPEDRIREMYMKYVVSYPDTYEADTSLPVAFVFDIDGTLAHMGKGEDWGRDPHDLHKVKNDRVDRVVKDVLEMIGGYTDIIILTGRKDICLDDTKEWLNENGIEYTAIFARASYDNRNDAITKKELFFDHVAPKWNVQGVFDDRNRVVDMWRELGIKCFQCQPGDF